MPGGRSEADRDDTHIMRHSLSFEMRSDAMEPLATGASRVRACVRALGEPV